MYKEKCAMVGHTGKGLEARTWICGLEQGHNGQHVVEGHTWSGYEASNHVAHTHQRHYGRTELVNSETIRGFVHPLWRTTSSYQLTHSHNGGGEAHEHNEGEWHQ